MSCTRRPGRPLSDRNPAHGVNHRDCLLEREAKLWEAGYRFVAGVDEVGRGPLAGPVVAAAVILIPARLSFADRCTGAGKQTAWPTWIVQLRDSKKLTARKREFLCTYIRQDAVSVGIGIVSAAQIDDMGITAATDLAMCIAVERLTPPPDFVLVDGIRLPPFPVCRLPGRPTQTCTSKLIQGESIIRGDNLSRSIAAASIVAKVERDMLMVEYDSLHPGYGFARHKGYPTAEHLAALKEYGCSPIHRRSFAPVQAVVE